jgi:perosamine synthetase
MNNQFIPVNRPLLDGNEKKYLNECIDTGWISSEGPFINQFEEKFAARVGRKYGVAVCNGSVALDVAMLALKMLALKLPAGSEVIMPTFTIISCVSAIIRAGLVPVFIDSDAETWNMDVSKIEEKITAKTSAIMVVHIYGLPTDMDLVFELAKKYNLKIIEDAAEMHGQIYKGRPCGSLGDISTFSFYPNKHITTGEGGMIVTDDIKIANYCRSLKNLCFKPERRFVHDELGFNFRMTNIQAALGLAQLERLDEFVEKKRALGKFYTEQLKSLNNVQLPLQETDYAQNIYWVFGIIINDDVSFDAAQAIQKLAEKNIGCRPFFWCMHEQPVLQKMGLVNKNEKYPAAERIARRGFYIPSGLGITEQERELVVKAVREVLA